MSVKNAMKHLAHVITLIATVLLCGSLCMPTAAAVPATAAEPDGSPAPAATTDIGWGQLGLSDELALLGANQRNDVAVPIPQGVIPTALTGQIGSVVNAVNGRVDVLDSRGVFLGAIGTPTGLASEPFIVDISAAEITDGAARLNFVLRNDTVAADSCTQVPSVTLTQLATAYSGPTPNPRTVADFLPGYLDQISIRVGPTPTRDQQQAALDLVAKLTHLYRQMPVRIDVDTSAATATPLVGSSRVIEIRDGGRPGLTVVKPDTPAAALVISGSGRELLRQVDLFADRRAVLAQTTTATVTSADEQRPQSTNMLTFGRLGMTGQASVLGTTTMYAGFDVSDFASGQIDGAKVHLLANYTPVVAGEGSLLIRSGSTVVASRSLDSSGAVDLTADIPAEAVRSNVGLGLELRYVPKQECAPLSDRMTFALDPRSTVTVTPGSHNRGGFPVLPMAFTPDVNVAVAAADQIRYAAAAINLMGQQSAVTLRPNLIPLDEAGGSRSGLILVGGGADVAKAGLTAPVLPGDGGAVTVNGDPSTGVELGGPLGVIQAFTDNGRTVLAVSGTGDWALVGRSFDYIRGLEDRWASLSGDVVATGAAGDTVNLTVAAGGPMPYEPTPGTGWQWWAWFTAAAGSITLVAAAVLVIRRRLRR